MKIDRLIGILSILLQEDKTTEPELAERFEVSRRTINRDIEDLCKAGIPPVSVRSMQNMFLFWQRQPKKMIYRSMRFISKAEKKRRMHRRRSRIMRCSMTESI